MNKKRKRKFSLLKTLLIVLLSCALSFGIAYVGKSLLTRETFGQYKTIDIANLQGVDVIKDGFVYYDGGTVSCISSNGSLKWSYLVGSGAGFKATDNGVAAWVNKSITLIDSKTGTTTYNGTMDENVISAYVGSKYSAIVIGESKNQPVIILMEPGGRQVNRIVLDSETVLNYGFYSNGSLLWAMICNTNGTVPTTTVRTYRPGKEIVGSITDAEQLNYAVMFQQNQVVAAGDNYLKTYDYTGSEETSKRKLIYGWYLVTSDNNYTDPLMVLVNDSQYSTDSAVKDVRLIKAGMDKIVRMPFGCRDVCVVGDMLYGFSADGYLMKMNANDVSPIAYELGIEIDNVYGVTEDNVAVVESGGRVYLVQLV